MYINICICIYVHTCTCTCSPFSFLWSPFSPLSLWTAAATAPASAIRVVPATCPAFHEALYVSASSCPWNALSVGDIVAVLHMGKWSLRSNNSSRMHRGNAEFSRRWIPPWSRSLFSHVGPQTLLVFREIIIAEYNVYARALIKDYLSCSRWRCSFVDHKGGKTPYSMILILFLCNMNCNVQFHRLGTGFSFLI